MSCFSCEHQETNIPSFIFESDFWRVYLHPDQAYLGRSVVVLKEHKESLSDLSEEGWQDLHRVIKKMEKAIKIGLGAEMFNWASLMNDAYQEENPEPHVHWHLRPRYKKEVIFEGQTFSDPDFGYHYNRNRKEEVSEEIIKKIVSKIKSSLK